MNYDQCGFKNVKVFILLSTNHYDLKHFSAKYLAWALYYF